MKCFFWVVYSLGLRLQEALHLQVSDIDSQRMLVHVRRGKGHKDRRLPLTPKTLQMLRVHWLTHRRPQWLFPCEGRNHKQASTATLNAVYVLLVAAKPLPVSHGPTCPDCGAEMIYMGFVPAPEGRFNAVDIS